MLKITASHFLNKTKHVGVQTIRHWNSLYFPTPRFQILNICL